MMSVVEYKSNVFAMLMEIPEYALEVYNVLNGSHHEDLSEIQIKKLNSGVILSVKNDASFLLDSYLNLYEHQSTHNPNMPLRFLIYFSSIMQDIIKKEKYDLYGKKRIPIPTPKFVVFYNGLDERPEKEVMHLSDAFLQKEAEYQLELSCEVYNINPGNNVVVMEASRVLNGYTTFVEKVRMYINEEHEIKEAVSLAVEDCIRQDILSEFFRIHRKEVEEVAALDFTFERREELIRRDSFEEGIEKGIEKGRSEGREEGRLLGKRMAVIEALEEYCTLSEEWRQRIETEEDEEKLKSWNKAANRAETFEEFVKMIESEKNNEKRLNQRDFETGG